MARLQPIDCRELKRILTRLGFEGQPARGAHEKWAHPNLKGRKRTVMLSCHNAPFHRGILNAMIEQMGLSREEFMACRESEAYTTEFAQQHSDTI